jgi:hypothetical protein
VLGGSLRAKNLADAPTRRKIKCSQMEKRLAAGFQEVRWCWPRAWLGCNRLGSLS